MRPQTLVLMIKEPRPGQVKSRLGRDIGMVPAAWWFRHQCRSLIRRLRDPRWTMVLAVSPDRAGMLSRVWPPGVARNPQAHGALGVRMKRQIEKVSGPVCVIGADIPGIGRRHIARAFHALGSYDTVFGPAHDGGYWLIGWAGRRKMPRSALRNVRWSTEHALADSIASLPGCRIALTDCLRDVDTIEDLHRASRP